MTKACPHLILFILALCPSFLYAQSFTPGNTYSDTTGFVSYQAGNLPIIISAPHGGDLQPDSISDRDCNGCVYLKDSWTKTITEGIYEAFFEQSGCYPHVIINLLHRKKFDANRDIEDAADGNPIVEKAWEGYHAFIDSAKIQVSKDYARGLFLDIHGHAHTIQRIELGYLLSKSDLQLPDAALNSNDIISESSLRSLVNDNINNISHSELLRGHSSFGEMLYVKGFPSVPSASDPFPQNNESYFSGGYNTRRHGSQSNEGTIDAIQVELNQDVRFDELTRAILIDSLTAVANQYINHHYNPTYLDNFCSILSSDKNVTIDNDALSIFPNPASDILNVKTNQESLTLSIFDFMGHRLLVEKWKGDPINVSALANGSYFILIRKDDKIVGSMRFIKL